MMQDDEIEQKLKIYDEAIDFYMDVGRLPDTISPDDILGEFIAHTIDDNPQLSSQDHLWSELLKDEMLSFIENMLDVFQPIEETYRKEKAYIKLFSCGDIETKIKMWSKVVYTIRLYYILEEINIDGYIKQLETEDQETVYNAFLKDWDRASYERQMRRKRQALEQNRKEWEQQVKNHGLTDYRSRQKIEHIFYSYPKLKEILKIIGREEQIRVEEMDETVLRYLPLLPSAPRPAKEVEEIANGKDLQHLLPEQGLREARGRHTGNARPEGQSHHPGRGAREPEGRAGAAGTDAATEVGIAQVRLRTPDRLREPAQRGSQGRAAGRTSSACERLTRCRPKGSAQHSRGSPRGSGDI